MGMKVLKSKFRNIIKMNSRINLYKNEKLSKLLINELPSPYKGYTPSIYFDFSNNLDDICENILEINIEQNIADCFKFFMNIENFIHWNPCIFQIIAFPDRKLYVIHLFIKLGVLPVTKFILPIKIAYS